MGRSLELCLDALTFSVKILNRKTFSEDFVEKYVNRARQLLRSTRLEEEDVELIQSISQKLLESPQGNFFFKLISELPEEEMFKLVAKHPREIKHWIESVRALLRCANCEKLEKSLKEFKKCLGCNSVYYCSKDCQRAHWPSHKNICK